MAAPVPESSRGTIVVYEAPNGDARVEVRLDRETVWLAQQQMADLFGRERSVVARHVRNAYREGELDPGTICVKFSQVQIEGGRFVSRDVDHFNLVVVISVRYRVKSQSGTQFRIWATRTLRDQLVRGYTLNRQRFEQNARELEMALALVRKTAAVDAQTADQGRGLVGIVARYTQTFLLLQRYDEGLLREPKGQPGGDLPGIDLARAEIDRLKRDLMERRQASDLFGRERDAA